MNNKMQNNLKSGVSKRSALSQSPKRLRLYELITNYHRSVLSITTAQLKSRQSNWIQQQLDFLKTLHKKLNKYSYDAQYCQQKVKLEEVEERLNQFQYYSNSRNNHQYDQSVQSESDSQIRHVKSTNSVSHSIDKLKETIGAKQKLLMHNYQAEKKRNQQLMLKIRKQTLLIEQLNQELASCQKGNTYRDSQTLRLENQQKEEELCILRSMLNENKVYKNKSIKFQEQDRHKIDVLNGKIAELNHQIAELNAVIQTYAQQLEQKTRMVNKLVNQSEHYAAKYSQLKAKVTDFEQQYNILEQEYKRSQQHILTLESQNESEYKLQLEQLQQTNQNLNRKLHQIKTQLRTAQQRADLYKQKYLRSKHNTDDTQYTNKSLEKQRSQQTFSHFRSTQDNKSQQNTKKLKVLSDLKDLVKTHRMQIQTLR